MSGRRQKRWTAALILALLLALPPGSAAGETRRAVDQVGRTVGFPARPSRVIALAPSITEIVFALGREKRLAGVTQYSDYPREALSLPKVGTYIHLDLERIVALKPDLCIAVKDGNPKATVDRMVDLGIPVFAVNPMNLDSVMKAVTQIGMLLNAEAEALAVTRDMTERVDRVQTLVARTPERPKVFFQIGISPIVSAGPGTFIHQLIVLAGGRNLAQGPAAYPRFSREEVLMLDPDVMVITSMARMEVFEEVKAEWSTWPGMSAVKTGRIHIVDSNILDRPTPRMVDGLELLARLIHPELYGNTP